MKSIDSGVCHRLMVHFVMDRASLFTDKRISSLPIRAKYTHFRTIWEHTCGNSPIKFHFLFFCEVLVIDAWSGYFVELLSRLVRQLTISLYTFLCMTFHIIRPWKKKILRVRNLFSSLRGNLRFKHGSVIVHNLFAYFALSLSAAQVYMIHERCWFSQIDFNKEYFLHRIKIFFLSNQFHVVHIHR